MLSMFSAVHKASSPIVHFVHLCLVAAPFEIKLNGKNVELLTDRSAGIFKSNPWSLNASSPLGRHFWLTFCMSSSFSRRKHEQSLPTLCSDSRWSNQWWVLSRALGPCCRSDIVGLLIPFSLSHPACTAKHLPDPREANQTWDFMKEGTAENHAGEPARWQDQREENEKKL